MQEERKTEKGRGHMIKCLWTDLGSAGLENILALGYRYDLFSHSAYDKIFVSSSLFGSVDPSF